MKPIKDSKSVGTRTLAHMLVVMLLLSSVMGTIVWAGKPEKPPGKPDNPGKTVETWDLQIYIGIKDPDGKPIEDIVLMEPDYLSAEDVPCSGGLWNFPEEPKGKSNEGQYVSAQFSLFRWFDPELGVWTGDECGSYTLANKPGTNSNNEITYLDEIIPANPEYYVGEVDVGHQVNPLGEDFWWFMLIWRPLFLDPDEWQHYWLCAWTNKNSDPEVVPPEGDELVVTFEEVNAVLSSDLLEPMRVPENYDWLGTASFTITIIREPHVA